MADVDGWGELEAAEVAAGYPAEEVELDESASFDRAAAATSVGTITGLLPREDKSIAPSDVIVSGFIPAKARVKRMFSAVYD
jgi:hypothetical protein